MTRRESSIAPARPPPPPPPRLLRSGQQPYSYGMSGKEPYSYGDRAVPLWEMSFYRKACGVPFERLRCMRPCSYVKNVLEWDDSAAVEALRDAKARYFDWYHGRRSAVPPPDPDAYIDEIDHDAPVELDPELMEALERRTPSESDDDGAAAGADPVAELRFEDLKIVPTGWDVETAEPDPLASLMRPIN